mmetsp:Transcript_12434/g.18563  ORF Transcript_12434/g.18563 Transcript_12434/m.18563 type:complete len:317 (+) Transcript_12434:54-1004(+)|eukprot:CAMPEP_0167759052 /NCGR_PEP_ID=MMETSP0110_2-20121227/10809_1 /TAXON_ID=629695 /ORGANISM="Gymnochlora sp., Strain CCMP2014" /LENGTH=316 /DNA_ID=CAMNT_0007645395 /DNA_START=39 /DNA_END=989 /DNA_ORIENTATION=+
MPLERPPLEGWNLIGTLIVTALYIIFGAACFYGLEHNHAVSSRKNFDSQKQELFQAAGFNTSQQSIVEELMTMAASERYSPYRSVWKTEAPDEIWSYGESLYFTLVTLSTVGYGDMSPQTDGGKVYLIFYTLIGIPMVVLVNLSLGGYVLAFVFWVVRKADKMKIMELKEKKSVYLELILLSVVLLLAFFMTLFFSGLLTIQESWSYLDALYFTWTTLTTIGYGDLNIENNNYITASFSLIVLLSISFAAASAFIAILSRIFHFKAYLQKKPPHVGSRMPLADEQGGLELPKLAEMKEISLTNENKDQAAEIGGEA